MKLTWFDILSLVGIVTALLGAIGDLARTQGFAISPGWSFAIIVLFTAAKGVEAWLQRKVAEQPSTKQVRREKELQKRAEAAEARSKSLEARLNARITVPEPASDETHPGYRRGEA